MNIRELLLLEAARRQRWRDAVLAEFEITGSPRDRVKRREVAGAVARRIGVLGEDPRFQRAVIELVVELGGVPIRPQNKAYYRKVRRRGAKDAPR